MKCPKARPAADSSEPEIPDIFIERLVPGGHGFVKLTDGSALMVPGALPGDRVKVLKQSRRSGAQYAEAWQLVAPGPDRVPAVCEVHQTCGGCDLMALSKPAQVRAKLGLLRDALVRVGGLDESTAPATLISAGSELGYRGRLRLQVSEGKVGFFQRSSRSLVQPKRCHVAAPEVEQALSVLRRAARKHPGALDAFAWVEVRAFASGVSLFFQLSKQHSWVPVLSEPLLRSLRGKFLVACSGDKQSAGLERFELASNVYMYAAPGAFTQVNWPVNCALTARVVALALEAKVSDFMDLYCGSGNFSLPLMAAGLRGVGVESSQHSVSAATQAAREQELQGRFVTDDAGRYVSRAFGESRSVELIILDPPRSGVKQALAAMAQVASRHICMVSCDPVTFARDLRALSDAGFSVELLEAYDMFPQTHHVESLAWLTRVP